MAGRNRPIGITVTAILEMFLGLGNLFIGYVITAAFDLAGIAGLGIFGDLLEALGFLIGGILFLAAILHFLLAYGFLREQGWAWVTGLILSIIGIFFGIILIPIGVVTLVANAIIIYYLNTPAVIESFRSPS